MTFGDCIHTAQNAWSWVLLLCISLPTLPDDFELGSALGDPMPSAAN